MMEIAKVENGLAYKEISWTYMPDKLDIAMGIGHPADFQSLEMMIQISIYEGNMLINIVN